MNAVPPLGMLLTRFLSLSVATAAALTITLQVCLAAAEAVKVVSIADFEKDVNGFSQPLQRDGALAQQGQGSGKIEVTFSANKRWVTANRVLDLPHELKEVRFWVRSTDAHGLTFRLIDETGQTHQQRPKFAADGKWHQITINTFTSGEGYERFGGTADGRFHWPAQSIAFIFENVQNKLYDEGLTPYTPTGCQAYGRYGQAILEQYGRQIQCLEIWNEYNGTWCKGPATEDRPKFYTQMLKFAYEAIKAKRPDVKVGGGAAVLLPPPYFEAIFQHGGLDYMDAVVIHPYRSEPEGVEEEIAELKDLMRRYNQEQTKPIWVTETGKWDHTPEGRYHVAEYLVRMVTLLLSQDCERIYWYLMLDGTGPYKPDNFQPLEYVETPWGYEWKGPHTYLKSARGNGHPEATQERPVWAIRRWISNVTGTVKITGQLKRGANQGDGTGAKILADGREVFSQIIGGPDREATVDYAVLVPVKVGALLDFVTTPGPGTETSYDAAKFTVRIELLKE